jgi:hypothetical protein
MSGKSARPMMRLADTSPAGFGLDASKADVLLTRRKVGIPYNSGTPGYLCRGGQICLTAGVGLEMPAASGRAT